MGSASPPAGAFSPQELRSAYGINLLSQDGSGQTIAIIDAYDDPQLVDSSIITDDTRINASQISYNSSDLHNFDAYYGIPDFGSVGGPTFSKLDENGGTNYPTTEAPGANSWEGEETLDVEWAHAIAPGANIILLEANSESFQDLMTAVNTARNIPGVTVVSMSFEESDSTLAQSGINPSTYDSYFTTPSGHTGITFVASSGDSGAPSGFPAESPNVVAVGGTTLTLNGNSYVSESGWAGSGGGISSTEPQPSYQQGLVIHSGSDIVDPGGMRSVPDVSFDGDPNSGVAVYDSYDGGSSPWVELGGTSLGAPSWAGLIALADQTRVTAGMSTLDGPTQTLPALYSLPAADFHDITSGSSAGNPQYTAAAGYDLVTGLGTPEVNLLVPDLAGVVALNPPGLPADTVNVAYDQTLTASGGTGNITLEVSNIQNPIAGLVLPASGSGSLVISGTPTETGTETFTVTATDSNGDTASTNYSIAGNGAVVLGPASLPAATVNAVFNQTLTASGGTGNVTLVVSDIQNPIAGLVLPASGSNSLVIGGTPTAVGTETFTVTATDSLGATTVTNYSITADWAVVIGPIALPADTIQVAYNQTLIASGGTGNVTLVVSNIQNAIAGLVLPGSGNGSLVISGTPTATGTETFTVTATDAQGGTASTNYSIVVHGPVTLGPAGLPVATVNAPFDQTITGSGGTGSITLVVSNIQNAIAGLVLSASDSDSLTIRGTPAAAGTETFTVTATDSLGATTVTDYSITADWAIAIGPAALPADTLNIAFHQALTASGGTGNITLTVSNIQNAIAGLILPGSGNGSLEISGTPTATGTETFTVTATDVQGETTSTNYSITVNGTVVLGPATLPADTKNVVYSQAITASGGTGNITLVVSNIQNAIAGLVLPAGGSNSFSISGTPTATGTETFKVTATDVLGATISTNYSITVNGAVTLGPASLPADTVNLAYNQTVAASGGTGTITLVVSNIQNAIVGLILPASGDGSLIISGTPTAAGTETFKVTATDALGATTSTSYSIAVNGAVTLGPATLPADTVNLAYSQSVTAGGGTGNITLVVSDIQNAITGLVVPASGNASLVISGTPTAAGTETFTVTATDALGATTATNYSVTVTIPPALAGIEGTALAYTENEPAMAITAAITVADVEKTTLASATIWFSGNYQNGQDVLSFANTANITGNWNAATGTLTLTGSDTLADYQAALRAVKYQNTGNNPSLSLRTVSFLVNDGLANSNILSRHITVTAVPAVTGISPSTGTAAGGTVVTITGTGFSGATGVDFSSAAATSVVVDSSTQIMATCPAGTGTVDVTVTGPGGVSAASAADRFTYVADTVANEILDNSQPGFWSTSAATWATSTSGLNGSSFISITPSGSKESQAAWWFSMPAGVYEISITYTPGNNLTKDMGLDLYDGVGNWIGEIPVDEQVAPSSFTEDGVAWENLGAFNITSNVFHISTWNSSSDGAICVNGIQLQAAPIVDDSNAPNSYTYYPPATSVGNFTTSGSWTTGTLGAFGGSHTSSSAAGSGASTAAWTMPVTPGAYEVDVTWPASASLSANVTYSVFNGTTKIGSVIVDQKLGPSGISYDGLNWQSLGSFTVTGTQLSVSVANTAGDGQVEADAVRIRPSYQPTPIVDAGYPGFWSNTAWTAQDTGLYGVSLVSSSANGSERSQAAWWFPVQPGEYEIYATWVPGSNLSPTVPLDVYNALTYISEASVNEQVAPVGVADQGMVWQSLGVFTMTSNVLHVSTWNSQTNGSMCVDGIRIVPVIP
jgi:subtilase family serine protease